MKIWVALYHTESGDRGIVGYFNRKMTEQELKEYFMKIMPDEFDDGQWVFWDQIGLESIEA